MFTIYVRLNNDYTEFAHWHVMRDRKTKEIALAHMERYPTTYTKRTLGAAVAALYKKFGTQISRVEVKPHHDENDDRDDHGGRQGSAGYSEACGVYN